MWVGVLVGYRVGMRHGGRCLDHIGCHRFGYEAVPSQASFGLFFFVFVSNCSPNAYNVCTTPVLSHNMDHNLAQSEPAPDVSDLVTHPQIVKQQAAYIPGQDSVVSSDVPDHLGARAHADFSPFSSLGSGSGSSSNKVTNSFSGYPRPS